jgi:FlaA1/EpsC-like NDP-sugar epimerase
LEKTLAIGAALAALRFYQELIVIWLTGSGYITADVARQPSTLKKAWPVASMNGLFIVTGGAGFIGSHLVDQLVESGHRVRVVEKHGAEVGHLPPSAEVIYADIRERETLDRALQGAWRVYHLAANPNLWARDRREFEAVNHRGAVHVLEAALAAGA